MFVSFIQCFFFFQAEYGIRDGTVTGVQTCALPIFVLGVRRRRNCLTPERRRRESALHRRRNLSTRKILRDDANCGRSSGPSSDVAASDRFGSDRTWPAASSAI